MEWPSRGRRARNGGGSLDATGSWRADGDPRPAAPLVLLGAPSRRDAAAPRAVRPRAGQGRQEVRVKRFTRSLYLQVLVAVALGALLGQLHPTLGAR